MTQEEFFKRYTYSVRTDKIGGGGFGTVYKAYDNTLHREVAIKVSEVKTAANGKVFSLKDEFEALRGLPPHPNIANYEEFYSFDSPQGVFDYAVMQFYPDGNLSNLIKAGLDPSQKENVALQLLDGVAFLHQHKVVHRDLKPGNILIVKHDGKVIPLITDFGLSKTADTTDHSMFSNSFGGGTARYSSPEQLQGQPLRLNTDLWSYGVIVYELFTGDPLFEAGTSASNSAQADLEIYNKIINGDTGGRLGSVPEKWRKVLERCLVVNPEKRAKSAEELLQVIGMNTNGHAKNAGPKDGENAGVNIDGDGTDDDTVLETEKDPSWEPPKTPDLERRRMSTVYGPPPASWKSPKTPDLENRMISSLYGPPPTPRKLLPWIIGGIVAVVILAIVTWVAFEKRKKSKTVEETEVSIAIISSPEVKALAQTYTVNGVSFTMKYVKGGTFQMGATSEQDGDVFVYYDEKPIHEVTLSDFCIGETEVTQGLWKAVMGSNPSNFKGDNLPVETVSWNDCQKFIEKLNLLTGKTFRLPSEAEWEYAARGGIRSKHFRYSGSDTIDDVAWYDGNSSDVTHAVKTKNGNELGLYDMSGNVWEWCSDWYESYSSGTQTNPQGPLSGSNRVLRGGSWFYHDGFSRVSRRRSLAPGTRISSAGFRLVLVHE